MSVVALAMSACVPKATEKKAVCGTNESFNNITRSCYSIVAPNKAPVAANITPASFNEDIQSIITLSYSDVDLDLATSCALTNLSNVTVTSNCTCDVAGVCTVGVTGTSHYSGAASFSYSLKANNMVSNSARANLTILAVNDAPTISVTNQTTIEDVVKVINFTIGDVDNNLSCSSSVSVSANDNTTLIPNSNIIITGSAPNCIATVTPAANLFGTANLTFLVTDGVLTNVPGTGDFSLTVTSFNDRPIFTSYIATQTTSEDTSKAVTFSVSDADADSTLACSSAYLSITSSDILIFSALLVPGVEVSYSGTLASCTATLSPILNQNGSTSLRIYANDGTMETTAIGESNLFSLVVSAVNDAPVISAIADQVTGEDVAISVPFTISDVDNTLTCAGSVSVTTNDNQTLTPSSGIVISGTAPACTMAITPAINQSGATNFILTTTDGLLTATEPFRLTVTFVDDPPYFISLITASDTNEGGSILAGPFKVDEDEGSTADEDGQQITITSFSSDNPSVLPDSAITIFYDVNDNGIEDVGESRAVGVALDPGVTEKANQHNFYFKLRPVAGVSGNSNITFTITDGTAANDVTKTFSLIVHPIAALHGGWANISAIGIKADKNNAPVVVKTDSNGALLSSSDIKCDYNKSTDTEQCNTSQDCLGTSAPHGSVIPDAVNVLYWDSGNKKCYRSQEALNKFSWVEFTTSCPVTRVRSAPTTLTTAIDSSSSSMTVASTSGFLSSGTLIIENEQISYTAKTPTTFTGLSRGVNSTTAVAHSAGISIPLNTGNGTHFIEDPDATPAQVIPTATAGNQYFYDSFNKYCYKSFEVSPGVWDWDDLNTTKAYYPSKVTLSWNAFTVSGSGPESSVGIYGWNVYRREKDKEYDFNAGFLKVYSTDTMTINNATVRTFTDTTAIAGKVYYYLVRPVDNTSRHLTISTPEIFSEVRVLAPAPNYSFVHRWMVNQEVCNSMHMTTSTTNKVDPTKNYRCPYSGPGQVTISGSNYYDIEKDMLVDISEASCPYTPASTNGVVNCTSDGCVGIGNPTTEGYSAPDASVYYDRSSGSCWYRQAGAWVDSNSVAGAPLIAAKKVASSLNPPLVNISMANAKNVCISRTTSEATVSLNGSIAATLPEKKEYIAYSAGALGDSDSMLTEMEQGASLNIQSRCNSSMASGLEIAFTNSIIPSTSYIYSIAGTATSGIKSLYTGSIPWGNSYSTEACSSRYGVQDIYGNVAEWVQDSMTCLDDAAGKICSANAGTDLGDYDFDTEDSLPGPTNYAFDLVTGPYIDLDGDLATVIDGSFLTNWDFQDEFSGAGKFSFPVGMPINVDIAAASGERLKDSEALPFLLEIGPTSGITVNQLHDDGIIVNGALVNASATQTGSFAQGGSYLSGNRSGRYSSELVPDSTVRPDIGFRCIVPIRSTIGGTLIGGHDYPVDSRHTYPY